jgi:hypothetical protein
MLISFSFRSADPGYFFTASLTFSTALSTCFPARSAGPSLHAHSPATSTTAANAAAILLLDFIICLASTNLGKTTAKSFRCMYDSAQSGEVAGARAQVADTNSYNQIIRFAQSVTIVGAHRAFLYA